MQGEQVPASRSSMWPVVVLGILTAIIAWIWYRGSGEAAKAPVQTPEEGTGPTVTPRTEQEGEESRHRTLAAREASGESTLSAADPGKNEPNSGEQDVHSLLPQDTEVSQIRNKQQPKVQLQELSHVDDRKSGSEGQSIAAATNIPVQVEAIVTDQLSGDSRREEPQGDLQERKSYGPKENGLHGSTREHLTDLQRDGDLQAGIQEHPVDVPEKGDPQNDAQEHPADIPKKGDPQNVTQEHTVDIPQKGDLQTNTHDIKKNGDQTNIQEHLTDISEKVDEHTNLLEHQTYGDLLSHEGDVHPSEVRELPMNGGEGFSLLKKEDRLGSEEENPKHNDLDKAMVQATVEIECPTLMAEKLLVDTHNAEKSEQAPGQGKECLQSIPESDDGVYANGEVNGVKQATEHASGYPLENSFVKENAVKVLEEKKTLTQDLYLELIHTSNNHNAIVRTMCRDTEESSTGLQGNTEVCSSILKEFTQEGLSNVHKSETGLETSSMDIFNQEEMAGLGITNTFGHPSDANIHEIDHQKTRKVATIQPMPQNVNFSFRVHYITHSDAQIIAVTGDHEKLGQWEAYVPLTSGNGGFWSHSVTLPADATLAWKFVMVENGKIQRWEECNNRFLKTAHEDIEARLYWGYP